MVEFVLVGGVGAAGVIRVVRESVAVVVAAVGAGRIVAFVRVRGAGAARIGRIVGAAVSVVVDAVLALRERVRFVRVRGAGAARILEVDFAVGVVVLAVIARHERRVAGHLRDPCAAACAAGHPAAAVPSVQRVVTARCEVASVFAAVGAGIRLDAAVAGEVTELEERRGVQTDLTHVLECGGNVRAVLVGEGTHHVRTVQRERRGQRLGFRLIEADNACQSGVLLQRAPHAADLQLRSEHRENQHVDTELGHWGFRIHGKVVWR